MKCTHKMDRPCSIRGWKVSWQMLLLAASILSSCFLLTRAQETTGISIKVDPEVLKEGDHVTLIPEGLDVKAFITCKWYRVVFEERNLIITFFLYPVSGQQNGPAHTGRETGNQDCSLLITDLKLSDSGTYSFKSEGIGVINTGATNITVSEILSRPVLWPTESLGSENTSVTLYCNTSARLDVSILWFKDGNPVQSKTGLSDQNRTLNLTSITKEDEGIDTCQAVNPVSNAISNPSKITLACVCRRNGKTSTQAVSTPQIYENVPPPGQVHPENSSSAANTYETLQPRIPSVYEEIQR